MKKTISISEIKNFLKKKRLTEFAIFKKTKKNNSEKRSFYALSRTFLCSLAIIFTFISLPVILEFTEKNTLTSKNFENNSKNNFDKKLNNKDFNLDNGLNQTFLFDDVLQYDEQPMDTVRLSAATIEELFKSTNYNLEDVRKNKLVKPISLTLLPKEIKLIENTKKEKTYLFRLFCH